MAEKIDKTYTIEKRRGKYLVMWTAPGRASYVARKCNSRNEAEAWLAARKG